MRVADFLSLAEEIKQNYKEDDNIPVIIFDKVDFENIFATTSAPKFDLTWERMLYISERIEECGHYALDNELIEILRYASEI